MNYYSFDQSINEKVQKSAVQTSSGAPSAGQIPALNAAGQIDSSMLPSGSSQIVFGTSKPGVEDGSVLWVNQNPGYEGLYYFDTARNSWLDTAFITLHTGEDGADNTNLGFAGMNFASNYAGYNINQNMTIVSIFASCRDINNNSKELRIRERLAENNFFSTIDTFDLTRVGTSNSFPGYFSNHNANIELNETARRQLYINVAGTGSSINDVIVTMLCRRRHED